jgi:hypothetical protein
LDLIDYYWADTSPEPHHQPIIDKLPITNVAFQKVSNNKFPQFDKWSTPIIHAPKQADPVIASLFFGNTWNFRMVSV